MKASILSGRAAAAVVLVLTGAVAGIALLGTPTVADAAPKKKPPATHLGQRVEDLVVLNLVNPTTTPIFVRCHDDGSRDATEFTVPTGSHLVVTDVDWVGKGTFGFFATLRLFVETGSTRCPVALLTGQTATTPNGGGGVPETWGTTGILTGFTVRAGSRVVVDIRDVTAAVTGGDTVAPFESPNQLVILRGYLVKD